MKNLIYTHHLIKYFEGRLVVWMGKVSKEQQVFDADKAAYEKTIWHRWFKCQFEESYSDGFSYMPYCKYDDLWNAKTNVRELKEILSKLTYRNKCGFETTGWDFDRWQESKFYVWCSDNNIPHP